MVLLKVSASCVRRSVFMNNIGMIGLAVMGRSLALNMADHGFSVGVYNRSYHVTQEMLQQASHSHITGYETLGELVASISKPRKLMLMVKAGDTVDMVLNQLVPLLEAGDIVFDGGNSFFQDTIRREAALKEKGIHFFGVGISGGESGARRGPSIMPGGDAEAYAEVKEIFESIAATAKDGSPCCTYIGENGAGHFVKMVHNGIEYADMQIITEAYLLLKHVANLDNKAIAEVFSQYQQGELNSYLIQITSDIFNEKNDYGTGELIDSIKDASGNKGTGKWTSEEALRVGVDVSMITAAYHARIMSGSDTRAQLSAHPRKKQVVGGVNQEEIIKEIEAGMYAAKIIAYAQGFDLLYQAQKVYGWKLHLAPIAGIFRSGCIIQAAFLDDIMKAYHQNEELTHLLLDETFAKRITKHEQSLRHISATAILQGIPVPAFSSAIAYLDGLQTTHIGANLIQAQRDYFGAHTYERIDREGSFHHEWGTCL